MLELVKPPLPPSNIQAEQLLLGGMILGNNQTDRVVSFLKSEDFQEAVHQRIYQAICDDLAVGKAISPVLLKDRFERDGSLREIGGAEYLGRLAGAATTVIGVLDFAKEIYDLAKKRQLLDLCQTIKENVYDDQGKSSDEIINQISSAITEISFNPSRSNIKTSKQVTMMIYEDLKQDSACYSTGLDSLDKSMQGGYTLENAMDLQQEKNREKRFWLRLFPII